MIGKRRNQDYDWEAHDKAMLGPEIARHYVVPKDVYLLFKRDARREVLEEALREYYGHRPGSADAAAEAAAIRAAISEVDAAISAANAVAARAAIDDLRQTLRNRAAHPTAAERDASGSRSHHVPRPAEFILACVLSKKTRESLPGDLAEEFINEMVPKFGLQWARLWYWGEVVKAIGWRLGLLGSLFAWVPRLFGH